MRAPKDRHRRPPELRRLIAVSISLALLVGTATAFAAEETTTTTTTTTTAPSTTTTTTDTTSTTDNTEPVPEEGDSNKDNRRLLTPPPILFPVVGEFSFIDTFGAPRDGGRRRHKGNDIFAAKGTPVIAVANGTIEKVDVGKLAGQFIALRHDDGWRSMYMHLNNDTTGTDDGLAIGYAEGIEVGMHVTAGTVIGFVGDSGNAETTAPHLHFELHQPDGLKINPFDALMNAGHVGSIDGEPLPAAVSSGPSPETHNTVLLGHLDPDGTGFNAGIATHDGYVFMGTWGRRGRCPGTGIRVIDATDPTEPVHVTSFASGEEFPGTGAETIWVGEAESLGGTIGVVGVRLCDSGWRARAADGFVGLAIYDLTDPAQPVLLSQIHSGEQTQGVHHVAVERQGDRLLAAVTVPQSHLHHPDGAGDFRMYDVTDPSTPVLLSDWDLRRDGPGGITDELVDSVGDEALSGHSVSWIDPNHVVVAHSAGGMITLDVSDPTRPAYVTSASPYDVSELLERHTFDRGHGHNAHSGWLYDGRILVQDDQDLDLGSGEWGQQTFFDFSSRNPAPISSFATENSKAGDDGVVGRDGYYSAHQSVPYGETGELVAWFSDGVRVVDLTDASKPTETAFFVPPPSPDPQGWWVAPDGTTQFAMVWGVTSQDKVVYASDLNSGLWIFKVVTPDTTAVSIIPE